MAGHQRPSHTVGQTLERGGYVRGWHIPPPRDGQVIRSGAGRRSPRPFVDPRRGMVLDRGSEAGLDVGPHGPDGVSIVRLEQFGGPGLGQLELFDLVRET